MYDILKKLSWVTILTFASCLAFAQNDPVVPLAPQLGEPKLELKDFRLDALSSGEGELQLFFENVGQNGIFHLQINNDPYKIKFRGGKATHSIDLLKPPALLLMQWEHSEVKQHRLYHISKLSNGSTRVRYIPLWLSLFPPLIAIGLALLFREVIPALFAGIWTGAFIAAGMRIDSIGQVFASFLSVIDHYIISALNDSGHLSVIVFSLLIGGMVAIISRNGGMTGVVNVLSKKAKTARSSQLITWLLGIAIFFDDYANTLIVGNTMRSVTDRFKVSREKLAYIVDSTAAPVAAVAFITTWIGAELGYIQTSMEQMDDFPFEMGAYAIFLQSLKYAFYPFLTLIFIFILIWSGRDYGPMAKAEARAHTTGRVSSAESEDEDEPNMEDLKPVKGAPNKWQHAVIPVLAVILVTIYGLMDTGFQTTYEGLRESGFAVASQQWGDVWQMMNSQLGSEASFFRKLGILIGNADSYTALLWASLTGVFLAVMITLWSKTMNLLHSMNTMVTGFKTMMPAIIILTLAWALAITTEELHTAEYLTSVLEGSISVYMLPPIVFILAALISFSTGSSWSTMAILYPIAVPAAWAISQAQGLSDPQGLEILLHVVSVVLAASVLGDHCSPISDTTILSSLASDCNHIDHVRTQLPYALSVGSVSLAACVISSFAGGSYAVTLLCMAAGVLVLTALIYRLGKKVRDV